MKLSKRDIMLIINSLAINADVLSSQQEGEFPNSQNYESIDSAKKFFDEEYAKQPYLTFRELNDLFTRLTNETIKDTLSDEEQELLSLPPSEYVQ
jgi:hypothetical protein